MGVTESIKWVHEQLHLYASSLQEQPQHYIKGAYHSTIELSDFKQKITLIETKRNVHSVLDVAKIADLMLLVITVREDVLESQNMIDAKGKTVLSLLKAQGMASSIVVLHGVDKIQPKKQQEVKKAYQKWCKEEFPEGFEPRLVCVDSIEKGDFKNMSRWIHEETVRVIHWREKRSYLFVDQMKFTSNEQQDGAPMEPKGTLAIYGYLRGMSINAEQLMHLCNFDTFQIEKIVSVPHMTHQKKHHNGDTTMKDDEEEVVLQRMNESKAESLQSEILPDPLANEQTWPSKEEFLEAEENRKKVARVPRGFSEYQSTWIVDEEDEEAQKSNSLSALDDIDDDDDDLDDEEMDDEEMDEEMDDEEERKMNLMETQSMATSTNYDRLFNLDEDEKMTEQERELEREQFMARMKQQQEEVDFPDEVETPKDMPARVRFQKYRGLQSFKSSPWDPKESLPLDYAKIYQFEDLQKSQKLAYKEHRLKELTNIQPDQYIGIYLKNVPATFVEKYEKFVLAKESRESNVLIGFSLMRHEQKMSVLNLQVKKVPHYEAPIKAKDPVFVQIGFRTFLVEPIYSEHNPRCDKHRHLRFLLPSTFLCATIFAPITYKPAPVLMFSAKTFEMVATGHVMNIDPDRIVLKKILLTGFPYKVHKRYAVVRWMFFNPEDIMWFKPVEVFTKHGKNGIIKEPLGTHGYMKCQFEDVVQQNDTICMPLYKRVFPRYSQEFRSLFFAQ